MDNLRLQWCPHAAKRRNKWLPVILIVVFCCASTFMGPRRRHCQVRISSKTKNGREFVCPRLNDTIPFGEPFVLFGASCEADNLKHIHEGCETPLTTLEIAPVEKIQQTTKWCDAPKHQESLLEGREWDHYQLIDQTQRLCGVRDMYCEQHHDDPSLCTYRDLGLPPDCLAVAIGEKCQQSSKTQGDTYLRWKNAFIQAVSEREGQVKGPGPTDIVIHLRVGDVIDGSPFSVAELLNEQRLYYPGDNRSTYVKPYDYYDKVASNDELQKANKVWIVAGAHAGWNTEIVSPRPFKSCKYIMMLKDYFEKRGLNKPVELRLGHDPDSDVLFTMQSRHFVQGGGGFSRTLAMLVEARGGTIYSI